MNLLQQIKQEKNNIIDPIILFEALSTSTGESVRLIASLFARYNDDLFDPVHLNFYEYDEVKGIKQIKEHYAENSFIERIARGYDRVIITSDLDEDNFGYWALTFGEIIETDINGIIVKRPFYFDKQEVIQYLDIHNIPLPSCITQEAINTTNNSETINYNDGLQQRINQLEQELSEQKKINSEYVEVPFFESQEAFHEAYKQGKINSQSTENEKLIAENNQLKIDNEKLVKQLNKASEETENLRQQVENLVKIKDERITKSLVTAFNVLVLEHYDGAPQPYVFANQLNAIAEKQGFKKDCFHNDTVAGWISRKPK